MPLHHLYESGEYAEAADQGRELIEAHPEYGAALQPRVLREPRRADRRRDQASPARDRPPRTVPFACCRGQRLRPDPRRGRVQGAGSGQSSHDYGVTDSHRSLQGTFPHTGASDSARGGVAACIAHIIATSEASVIVRRPTEADAPAAAELVAALGTHFMGESEMRTSRSSRPLASARTLQGHLARRARRQARGLRRLFTKRHNPSVDIYVHPGAWNRGVGSHLLELVETDARRRGIGLLRNGVLDNDHRAHALLHARGYRIVRHFYRMAIELDAPPPPPEWPEGLRSSVYDSREARRSTQPSKKRSRMSGTTSRSRSTTGAGASSDSERGPDPLVRGQGRRRDRGDGSLRSRALRNGLGRRHRRAQAVASPQPRIALLRHCFVELYGRGQRVIRLGVDAENPTGATRLYERAGMRVVGSAALFEKVGRLMR